MQTLVQLNDRRLLLISRKLIESDIENAFASFSSNREIWKKIRNGSAARRLRELQKNGSVEHFHIECGRKTNRNVQ
jgi:hypothetical protein